MDPVFFPVDLWPKRISTGKNSVPNLQYGPPTRLVRTIYGQTFLLSCEIANTKTMYKENRFHLGVRMYSDNAQRTSKRVKSISHVILATF